MKVIVGNRNGHAAAVGLIADTALLLGAVSRTVAFHDTVDLLENV